MAFFETIGLDDNLIPESFEVDCPSCGEPLEIPLERSSNTVICPHCNTEIEIESA